MRFIRASALVATAGLIALIAGACTLIELPEPGATGAGGDAEVECTAPDDCLDPGTECILRKCLDGECLYEPADNFVPLSNQAVGDCVQVVCDGEGSEKKLDVEDAFEDGKECTDDTCDGGVPMNISSPGSSCRTGVCDAGGACVECIVGSDCLTTGSADETECQAGMCVPASCTNSIQDGDESDLDCGGPCAPCADGDGCNDSADCQSDVCDGDPGTCQAPACDDGVTNGDESDEDCGGPACDRCTANQDCGSPTDCASMVCVDTLCVAPNCLDGVSNGNETDVDCGGNQCGPCPTGKACKEARDCASGVCNVKCQAPTCSDGVKNGAEKGTDCGGPDCGPCQAEVEMEVPFSP